MSPQPGRNRHSRGDDPLGEGASHSGDGNRVTCALLTVIAVAGLSVQIFTAARLTPTHDEYWHLPIGLHMWQTGTFQQDLINPPLVRQWAAFPLYLQGIRLPDREFTQESDYGDALLEAASTNVLSLYWQGRVMIALISLVGYAIVCGLCWKAAGPTAGLLAGLLWMTDPNLTAHSSLVTHDLPATVGFLGVLLLLWQYTDHSHWFHTTLLGMALGLLQLTKFTGVLLVPLVVVWFVGMLFVRRFDNWRSQVARLLAVLGVCLLVVQTGYFFTGLFQPWGEYQFQSARLQYLQSATGLVGWLPIPVPEAYLLGLDRLFAFMQLPQPVYLERAWSLGGFRDYYYKCWLYKTPHLLQLASVVGLVLLLRKTVADRSSRLLILLTLPLGFVLCGLASGSANELGSRCLLPIYPFGIVYAACGLACLLQQRSGRLLRPAALVSVVVVSLCSLRFAPDHLTYFNELAGGPDAGRFLLVDSNLDWGQSLHELQRITVENDVKWDGLAYFGSYPPAHLEMNLPAPPSRMPAEGVYAVSLNFVQGRPHVIRNTEGDWRAVDLDEFGYFRFFDPVQFVGHSIAIYDLSADDVNAYHQALNQWNQ